MSDPVPARKKFGYRWVPGTCQKKKFGYRENFHLCRPLLTNYNPNKDFESVERPLEVEKFKLDRKIFSAQKRRKTRDFQKKIVYKIKQE